MKIGVLGAGAWGTALAAHAAARNDVRLWARDAAQAERIAASRRNERYLPGVALPAGVRVDADLDRVLEHVDGSLLLIATPMSGLDEMLGRLPAGLDASVLWLCKGLQQSTGRLGHEIAGAVAPGQRAGVLSGPSFAIEVARGQPTALVAASLDKRVRDDAVAALHGAGMRIYTSSDPVGVEVGGAVKNVLAIATGIADGLGLGLNARAALVTRGLAEMTRLGVALGAEAATFTGLSGLGDLVLTTTGDLSRNRTVGLRLATGQPIAAVLSELGHVAEGVFSAAMVLQRARRSGVEMPIVDAVVRVLDGELRPADALAQLMRRDARAEQAGDGQAAPA